MSLSVTRSPSCMLRVPSSISRMEPCPHTSIVSCFSFVAVFINMELFVTIACFLLVCVNVNTSKSELCQKVFLETAELGGKQEFGVRQ